MATYKKKGYKPQSKEEKQNEVEENSTTAEVFNTLDESASKAEDWVIGNQKYIFIIIAVVAAVVLGYLGYNQFIAKPKQTEAMNDMYQAQKYYDQAVNATAQKDSLFNLALNGGEGKFGMLDIVSEYGGTPAGNLANYYAGMAYLNTRDYKNAVSYLGKFSSDDEILAPMAKGSIGDAFVQLNQQEDALGYYEDAAKMRKNEFTTPMFLYKAGVTALDLGKTDAALKHFENIKENYPTSAEGTNIDIFIGKAEALASK
ncbi:tetratricopeptide repeat protein [Bizionia myxarmorum]|uniref:Tetratricopeptide repeat protein n=1 Tax=Bizionia myxarmorum TaxID=291186 RepID=A0A5D0R6I5_9FLAO|nr:tetratricopeptide repeat protein [Bizionia myxarmorum]TYB77053.1 tetratricopeptide repeat protein [Bizionia myxarmorum]